MKTIVLVHGLLMQPTIMRPMEKRFASLGFNVHQFSYDIADNYKKILKDLHHFVEGLNSHEIHLIGHSMGGLIVRAYIEYHHQVSNIRSIITLGSPHKSKRLGQFLEKSDKSFLGLNDGIIYHHAASTSWKHDIPIGCIAGVTKGGRDEIFNIVNEHELPSDGTVLLEEAILDNCTDSVVIEATHTSLLYKKNVVSQCVQFIREFKFE